MKNVAQLPYHVAVYNGKTVAMDYVGNKKREFCVACMRVIDNAIEGYVVTPKGQVYSLARGKGRASLVVGDVAADVLSLAKGGAA